MNERSTISAAIIACNEEKNLPGLLARLGWVDEVVVVDGGSTDGTLDLAQAHGCRVARRPFDDFASQRNFAASLARGDWIFALDADERPTPGLVREIIRRLPCCRQAAFRVPIRSAIFRRQMRFSGTQDDRPIRLYRRGVAAWTGSVHEVLRVRGAIGTLRGWLEHETLPDLPTFLAKMRRYTVLEAESRAAAGRPPRRRDAWLAPPREVFRRLIYKQGWLDGPQGWAFCLLSGLSEWVLAVEHRRVWRAAQMARTPGPSPVTRPHIPPPRRRAAADLIGPCAAIDPASRKAAGNAGESVAPLVRFSRSWD